MKVVIIGAGIAGLALASYLDRDGVDVVLNERGAGGPGGGHAFLMHTDGLSVLKELSQGAALDLPGNMVNEYSLRRPDGKEVQCLRLNNWRCIKRTELTQFLTSLLSPGIMRDNRQFTHFIYQDHKIVAAAFANGELEYGDIFVGADGGFSKVRESTIAQADFQSGRVKEVVGVAINKEIALAQNGTFNKFQSDVKGLSFGIIPTSDEELVWFMQYDPLIADVADSSPEALSAFCRQLMKSFPPLVQEVLEHNDFQKTYIWNTRDFHLLPKFYHENVVLIGDAAHLALPFTSAGTTNAMVDAKVLATMLREKQNYHLAFEAYHVTRSAEVAAHLKLGRGLRDVFLDPVKHAGEPIPIPLISEELELGTISMHKPVDVLYFTDPICSTCWIIQPMIRKMKLEYGNYLNIRYCMGGLLPSWTDYTSGAIQKPADAAEHWEIACACHDMPMDGDVWIEDPLHSSYPPSIAFKAAQLQDSEKAVAFLRRIQEMVFLEKKNIIKWEHLHQAAFDNGLDPAKLLRDFEGRAKELFDEDLALAKELEVHSFPTLFFTGVTGKQIRIRGLQPYEKLEEAILSLAPEAKKAEINTDPKSLFCQFPTMTDKEFSVLSNASKHDAVEILNALKEDGSIESAESKNGRIWKSKFDCASCGQ
jgi:2-polyprenyl-6-methoxyphenol hydroxylase-like FAD-dependent oxidoreductase/predicted DsbA family dithiol-disulfide isomerase